MTTEEMIVTVLCTFGAVGIGWMLSEFSRKSERKKRHIDTFILMIENDISHFSTLDDTASKAVMDFHFQSCLRLSPHLMTVKKLNPKKYDDLNSVFIKYDFEHKTKENYHLITRNEKDFPRRVLVKHLTDLKAKLHKL